MKQKITQREPLTSDIIFKAVFGQDNAESKAALIGLLNLVLNRKRDPITNLTYKNPFSISETYDEKSIIMDIKAESNSGELIDIEMQIGLVATYINRTIFYGCEMLTEGLERGEDYGKMKKSIVISFVKGKLFPQDPQLYSVFTLKENKTNKQLSGILELHYIELGKIEIEGRDLSELSELEKVGAYMKYSGDPEKAEYVEALTRDEGGVISMADKVLKKVSEEERLRNLRKSREMMELQIMLTRTEGYEAGVEEGIARGRAEGLNQGRSETTLEIAKNFKNAGASIEMISQATGLSEEEINRL